MVYSIITEKAASGSLNWNQSCSECWQGTLNRTASTDIEGRCKGLTC